MDEQQMRDARVEFLRMVCRGDGRFEERVAAAADFAVESEIIRFDEKDRLSEIVKQSWYWAPTSDHLDAAYNALGFHHTYGPENTLTDTRASYLREHSDISDRTLLRHELLGLGLLADLLPRAREEINRRRAEPATFGDLVRLEGRVKELEKSLRHLKAGLRSQGLDY